MGKEVECKLWYTRRSKVRMLPGCEEPRVRGGYAVCDHYIGETPKTREAQDVTDQCRRARKAREQGPIDAFQDRQERKPFRRKKKRK